jgi:signal transduction histidine kinase
LERLRVEYPKEDLTISCDGSKMEIVFSNLILNAVQAMEKKGNIIIKVIDRPDSIVIEVEDTGPGIPEHLVGKTFEPLFTTRQIGTGLGLVSCKSIVEKHGNNYDKNPDMKGTVYHNTAKDSLNVVLSDKT